MYLEIILILSELLCCAQGLPQTIGFIISIIINILGMSDFMVDESHCLQKVLCFKLLLIQR
jgi:hypothetical protein